MLFRVVITAAAFMFAVQVHAQDAADLGPAVGTSIPHDLSTQDATGATRGLENLVGENGLVLFFNRSIEWCPYCQIQAMDVSFRIDEFTSRGYNAAVLTYDSVEQQARFVRKRRIQATMLSDVGSEVIKAFGLLNTEFYKPGTEEYGVPYPAIFVLDSGGEIQAKFFEHDFLADQRSYRRRPEIDAVLAKVDEILAAGHN